ncbi:MAG: TIGR01777 family oxidoreductase [Nitrospiraceae bacterium]|nr:MAG: TIGR01777 family oxidoreductase [Nitrospiraceae bacterium]
MKKNKIYKIAISGATGFVGSNLSSAFHKHGWETVPLGRSQFKLSTEELAHHMEGVDVVINLSGAPVTGRWTDNYKKIMYESRIDVTEKLVAACSKMNTKPELFISTSAIGYYAAGDTVHTEEQHLKADDFLGNLARDWEGQALKAKEAGIRTVIFRFGVVIGRDGGALKQMLLPFKLGMGGTIGDGSQAFSWIHMHDLIRAHEKVIDDNSYEGIYNLTSPNPTTNRGLTESLGNALGRPTVLRVPKFILRMQMGEGAHVLMKGQKVLPKRLLDSGFTFSFSNIEEAVKDCVM